MNAVGTGGSVHESSGGLVLSENDGAYPEWLVPHPDGYVVNVSRTFAQLRGPARQQSSLVQSPGRS